MLLRPYTPTTAVNQPGFVDFVIKVGLSPVERTCLAWRQVSASCSGTAAAGPGLRPGLCHHGRIGCSTIAARLARSGKTMAHSERILYANTTQVYPEGRMSQHLDKMVLGDCILAKGPKGRFTYSRNLQRHIGAINQNTRLRAPLHAGSSMLIARRVHTTSHPVQCKVKQLRSICCSSCNSIAGAFLKISLVCAGMVAGGTGITPMWQVANHILSDGFADKTQVGGLSYTQHALASEAGE